MKKLTRKQALQQTVKVWDELAKTGDYGKPDWAHDEFYHGCPCCQFVSDRHKWKGIMICSGSTELGFFTPQKAGCPLWKLWPKGCESKGSPYDKWKFPDTNASRKIVAREILDHAKKELAKYKK